MTKIFSYTIICLLTVTACYGQTPKELTEKLINKKISLSSIASKELKWTNVRLDTSTVKNGQNLFIVAQSDTTTIISLAVSGNETDEPPKPKQFDVYLFYVKSNGKWYVDQIKYSTGLFAYVSMILSQIDQITPDVNKRLWIKSNMNLALKTDAELKKYFKENKQEFELLLKETKRKILGTTEGLIEASDSLTSKNPLGKLLLTYSSVLRPNCNCIAFAITDLNDFRVGFIHTADKSNLGDFGSKDLYLAKT